MATSVLIGPVNFLTIGQTSAQIEMNDADGVGEKLQLWADVDAVTPDQETQSMWVGLCQDALINGNELLVATESANSAQIISIRMSPAPLPQFPDSILAAIHQLL